MIYGTQECGYPGCGAIATETFIPSNTAAGSSVMYVNGNAQPIHRCSTHGQFKWGGGQGGDYDRGRAEERRAVVAWLRAERAIGRGLREFAADIETGAHAVKVTP